MTARYRGSHRDVRCRSRIGSPSRRAVAGRRRAGVGLAAPEAQFGHGPRPPVASSRMATGCTRSVTRNVSICDAHGRAPLLGVPHRHAADRFWCHRPPPRATMVLRGLARPHLRDEPARRGFPRTAPRLQLSPADLRRQRITVLEQMFTGKHVRRAVHDPSVGQGEQARRVAAHLAESAQHLQLPRRSTGKADQGQLEQRYTGAARRQAARWPSSDASCWRQVTPRIHDLYPLSPHSPCLAT
jgi:hypothetical protein